MTNDFDTKSRESLQPCCHCGSTRFGIIQNLWMEIVSESEGDYGSTVKFTFAARVCKGCGATTFFDQGNILKKVAHRIIGA